MDGTPSALIPTVLREGNECWCMQVRPSPDFPEVPLMRKALLLYLGPMRCFPGGSEVKASASNAGDPGSIPGSGRSPWTEKPGRSLVGYSPRGRKESDTTEVT